MTYESRNGKRANTHLPEDVQILRMVREISRDYKRCQKLGIYRIQTKFS